MTDQTVDISVVIIGYNEGRTLQACLTSAVEAEGPQGHHREVIYVDGGSEDESLAIARETEGVTCLEPEGRRRAAENRNRGLRASRGRYVQFLDGDMVMEKSWLPRAVEVLDRSNDIAAVCGLLREGETGPMHRALEIDWGQREGYVRHCGGAALWRREALTEMGGFPEHVAYGEEPYLCWRVRNERGTKFYQLGAPMADHHTDYRGFRDYYRRHIRMGATYAEIAALCARGPERLWLRESLSNVAWTVVLALLFLVALLGSGLVRFVTLALLVLPFAVKTLQTARRGHPLPVAALYALHTYWSKFPLAVGEAKWVIHRVFKGGK